jgi:hypothetical protein
LFLPPLSPKLRPLVGASGALPSWLGRACALLKNLQSNTTMQIYSQILHRSQGMPADPAMVRGVRGHHWGCFQKPIELAFLLCGSVYYGGRGPGRTPGVIRPRAPLYSDSSWSDCPLGRAEAVIILQPPRAWPWTRTVGEAPGFLFVV